MSEGWSVSQKEAIRKTIIDYADMRCGGGIQLHRRKELDEVLAELESIATKGEQQ